MSLISREESLLLRLKVDDPKIMAAYLQAQKSFLLSPLAKSLHEDEIVEVVSISFDKNQMIPPHNHPNMSAVQGCFKGTFSITSYEPLTSFADNVDAPTFTQMVKLTRSVKLRSGDVTGLTTRKNNIHSIKAEEYSQLIDIFVPPNNRARRDETAFLEIESTPVAAGTNVYRARPLI